jgi:hypothetical protein
MRADKGRSAEVPKFVIAAMAVLFSFAGFWAIPLSFGRGPFRSAFGQWWYLYYSSIPAAVAVVIYAGSIFRWRAVALVAWCMLAGYAGSLVVYLCLAMPSLINSVRAGRWELFFLVPLLPYHLLFILGAGGGALLMLGSKAIYKSWYSSPE